MGGLSKKAFQLEKIQDENQLPYLILDGGNLLFKHENITPGLLEQAKITAVGIVETYNLMKYDGVAVGTYDLAAGLEFLKELSAASEFPWLSANLVRKSDGKPVFTPSLIRRVGSITVGIVGLTAPDGTSLRSENENVVILPWQEVLPRLVAELSAECDLLILLSNYGPAQNQKIAESFSDVHIIFESTPHARNKPPQLLNNSLITRTGKKGKYLGWMLVNWQKSKIWGRAGAVKELALKKQELDGTKARISRLERRLTENERISNQSYQQLVNTRERLLSEIIFLENELYDLKNSGQIPATFENNFIVLDSDMPDQPAVLKIVSRIKKQINQAGRKQSAKTGITAAKPELPADELIFTGWQTCQACHGVQTDFWRTTDHAAAYQSLVEQDQQFNLDCLPCHVTAEYKDIKIGNDDRMLLSLPTVLQQVGCEVCHGPGRIHSATQDDTDISRKPGISICTRCHTEERDENFNYENDVKKIACPAGNSS